MKYAGKKFSLATKHRKESVISPIIQRVCQASIIVADVDTDQLGTFSGEIAREGTPREVVQKKARMGMQVTGLPYGIATEGSFGPHPSLPFIPYHEEVLVFIDDEIGCTLFESLGSDTTNFQHSIISSIDELEEFASRVQFPGHGVIIRPYGASQNTCIVKGITNQTSLEEAFFRAREAEVEGKVIIETDMRAHLNPTRMAAIAKLTERMAQRLITLCPQCSTPGWGATKPARGLPCCDCGTPTSLPYGEIYTCAYCGFENIRALDSMHQDLSSMYCPSCNP